jgi:hypothetical protein
VDFFNYHAYPSYPSYDSYRKLAGDSPRELGNYVALMTLCAGLKPRTSILGEAGNDRLREANYPELRQLITRDCLWLAFLHGSPGGITWDAIADPREFLVISTIASTIDWTAFERCPALVAVVVHDTDAELPNLARYTWWSLEQGVPVTFVSPDAPPMPGQVRVEATDFTPPARLPAAPVSASKGYQVTSLRSRDGKVFVAYLRNLAEVPRINTRTRAPVQLRITVRPGHSGNLEVWDLDLRKIVKKVRVDGTARIELGETCHDFALVLTR